MKPTKEELAQERHEKEYAAYMKGIRDAETAWFLENRHLLEAPPSPETIARWKREAEEARAAWKEQGLED